MKEILFDFPDHFETERLLIRAPRPGDGKAVNVAIMESLDELRPWFIWLKTIPAVEDTETNIRQACANYILRQGLRKLIFLKETGEFVGSSGFHDIDWRIPKMEIGYWGRTKFTGQGLMTEAVQGLCGYAFETLGVKRLEIRCDATNERSRKMAERLGFQLEGRLPLEEISPEGELRDTLIFGLLRNMVG